MKTTGMLIATGVLLALTGALYWSDHRKVTETTASASSTGEAPAPKILSLKDAEVSRTETKKKGTDPLPPAKDPPAKGAITTPKPLAADQEAAASLVSTVSTLSSDRLVDEKPSDLKQFGLASPALEVDVTTKDKPQ